MTDYKGTCAHDVAPWNRCRNCEVVGGRRLTSHAAREADVERAAEIMKKHKAAAYGKEGRLAALELAREVEQYELEQAIRTPHERARDDATAVTLGPHTLEDDAQRNLGLCYLEIEKERNKFRKALEKRDKFRKALDAINHARWVFNGMR